MRMRIGRDPDPDLGRRRPVRPSLFAFKIYAGITRAAHRIVHRSQPSTLSDGNLPFMAAAVGFVGGRCKGDMVGPEMIFDFSAASSATSARFPRTS